MCLKNVFDVIIHRTAHQTHLAQTKNLLARSNTKVGDESFAVTLYTITLIHCFRTATESARATPQATRHGMGTQRLPNHPK